jgi:peptidoglycan hydrolase CwlO-like protein
MTEEEQQKTVWLLTKNGKPIAEYQNESIAQETMEQLENRKKMRLKGLETSIENKQHELIDLTNQLSDIENKIHKQKCDIEASKLLLKETTDDYLDVEYNIEKASKEESS